MKRFECALSIFLVSLLFAGLVLTGCDDSAGSDTDTFDQADADSLPVPCEPNAQSCWQGRLAICLPDGAGWVVEDCGEAEVCIAGLCEDALCQPGSAACDDQGRVVTCLSDGSAWGPGESCSEGETCSEGSCVSPSCDPGTRLCGAQSVMICSEAGTWEEESCEESQMCWQGECVDCVSDEHCEKGQSCTSGRCEATPLTIESMILADGMIQQPYSAFLTAMGGVSPYSWSGEGLPAGLSVSTNGEVSGVPSESGVFTLSIVLEDAEGTEESGDISLTILESGLAISTNALDPAMEGFEYSYTLQALGGETPYYWGISSGALPAGLSFSAEGELWGTPSELGDFPLTFKVFDDSMPPAVAEKALTLTVEIAPLEIYGEEEMDLIFTKVITLPLLAMMEGIPLPYETQLLARGGLKPYAWVEVEMPQELSFLIPQSGIPDGLTLSSSGTLSGSVTDPSQAITVEPPFTDISVTGFFFMAEVSDSQEPAESETALYVIPTLPVGGN